MFWGGREGEERVNQEKQKSECKQTVSSAAISLSLSASLRAVDPVDPDDPHGVRKELNQI